MALKLSRYLQLFILVFLFNSHAYAEDWQLLFNRAGDGKAIEYDVHSIKADQGVIFLNIRYSPRAGVTSLFNNVAFHMESIVVSCERESYAVVTEADHLKDGKVKIKSLTALPDATYITPPNGSEPQRIITILCGLIFQDQPSQQNKATSTKSKIIEGNVTDISWRYIATSNEDNSNIYVDTLTIARLDETNILVTSKYEHPNQESSPNQSKYKYALMLSLISCDTKTIAILGTEYFSDNNFVVDSFYADASEIKETSIPSNSMLDHLRTTSCPIGMSREIIQSKEGGKQNTEGPKVSTGTGWQISPNHIISSYHVVDGSAVIQVAISKKDSRWASVVAADKANDIVILKLEGAPLPNKSLKIATNLPKLGSRVAALGYPLSDILGNKIQATSGEISALSGYQDDQRFFQISAPIQSGNSGGPLINRQGEVIGIVTSGLGGMSETGEIPQNIGFALKFHYVKALVDSAGVKTSYSNTRGLSSIEDAISNVKDSVYLITAYILSNEEIQQILNGN